MATARRTLKIAELLGGSKVLGPVRELADIQEAIREGLPYGALESFARTLALPQSDLMKLVGLAPRTQARRKQSRHLSPVESDRLYRIARIMKLAADTLGGVEQARTWLNRSNRSLGGHNPLTMLDTEIGVRQVEDALVRINYGMYG